jgi:hypothetical protein
MNFTIDKDKSATFRYRILFLSGKATPEELTHQTDVFDSEK